MKWGGTGTNQYGDNNDYDKPVDLCFLWEIKKGETMDEGGKDRSMKTENWCKNVQGRPKINQN